MALKVETETTDAIC